MADATRYRFTECAGQFPARGTYGVAANTRLFGGTIAFVNAAGNLEADNSHNAAGIIEHDTDNTTTSETAGVAGALTTTVLYGVHGLPYTGTTPIPGQVMFAVDNQTVSTDSSSSTRGIAGMCTEVRNGLCYLEMGPHVVGMIAIGSVVAADVATLQGDVDDLQATATAVRVLPIPLTAWTDGGAPLSAFADGTTNGLALVDSEALGFRFNPVGSDTSTLVTSVAIPADIDRTENLELHALVFRVGSADTTAALSGSAFFQVPGSAHTADADAITADSAAIDAATTVVQEAVLTIAAADIPALPCSVTLLLTVSSALDADDLVVTSTWLEYTPAITAA